jgi:arsenate reductase
MDKKLVVYLKPTCSKCREAVRMLTERKVKFDPINYYEVPFTEVEFKKVLRKLGAGPRDLLRKNEPIARELGLAKRNYSDDELIGLMVKHPDLIQRPIVVRGDRAVLGRPPENIEKLL